MFACFSYSLVPRPCSAGDRTMEVPLHQTNQLYRRCQTIKEYNKKNHNIYFDFFHFIFRECLREISPDQLERVLHLLDNISEAEMKVSDR
jgi:hypothetical protein